MPRATIMEKQSHMVKAWMRRKPCRKRPVSPIKLAHWELTTLCGVIVYPTDHNIQ